ncbi:unnamed protein product [Owenia fusiformis]|uniref:RING-type domain-containing protein n=1 Tax=Owenia fusiformis TaxID=6347 RepID=A0A8S4NK42_OWEFU|nr:unnamed protein product [Owenia fusiformis]CAH1781967.1 unnamed protein product [Owenia fusiformis]
MTMVHARIPAPVTALYVFAVLNLMALFHVTLVEADVAVLNFNNETVQQFYDYPANFGPSIHGDGLRGYLVLAKPHNGCSILEPPPSHFQPGAKWIVIIRRTPYASNCDFVTKVRNAQKSKYDAVIIHNVESQKIFPMPDDGTARDIKIPAVFVGEDVGIFLERNYLYTSNFTILLDRDFPIVITIDKILLPFAIVVAICFVLMLGCIIGKWIMDWRKKRRSRLSRQNLKKLPTKKFKKGDPYETCAICLDDYEEGDKLRILPCQHAYHMKCVDPWLTKNKRVCPICKRRVIPGDHSDTESETDDEVPDATESTPLLVESRGTLNRGRSSTFENSGLPGSRLQAATMPPPINNMATNTVTMETEEEEEEGAIGGQSISDSPPELHIQEEVSEREPLVHSKIKRNRSDESERRIKKREKRRQREASIQNEAGNENVGFVDDSGYHDSVSSSTDVKQKSKRPTDKKDKKKREKRKRARSEENLNENNGTGHASNSPNDEHGNEDVKNDHLDVKVLQIDKKADNNDGVSKLV